jgi:GNAT superfamily N-acetyltransferase
MTKEATRSSDDAPRIRLAVRDDLDHLVEFNRAMALETEARELDRATVTEGVRAVLEEPSRGFYVIAQSGTRVVGGLLVTYEWSDWRNGMFLWIQSVYIQPEARGHGIFRQLYDFVRTHGRARGDVCGFRLYVEGDNRHAQRVYAALGMSGSDYLMFEEELARDG